MARSRVFSLTPDLVAAHAGSPVVCLDARAIGREFRAYARRPGPELNRRVWRDDLPIRADVIGSGGVLDVLPAVAGDEPVLTRVDICGVLEQRAMAHPCGYNDGHDAIAERLCAAFEQGDVLLVCDSPGGAHAGLQEAVKQALAAKEEHGRRVTTWVGEMCGSACAWWAFALSDAIYLPESGILGSIGARSAHCSIAGHLAQEGVEHTYFAAPGAGKVAFAPELPLSEEGKARGERDVWIAYEAFEAAVCASPVGQRYGLTPEALRALDADALTGQRAVDAGLADGVASLVDVTIEALAYAGAGSGDSNMTIEAGLKYSKKVEEKYEEEDEEEPDKDGDGDEEEEDVAASADANEEEEDKSAKAEGDPPGKPAPPKAPPPAKAKKAAHPPPPERMRKADDLAAILGATGDSLPALKAAALGFRQIRDYAATLTGQDNPAGILGGMEALAKDAAAAAEYKADLRKARARANAQERMGILRSLARANIHPRGELFVDVMEGDKIVGQKPAPLWGPGKEGRTLANLRGYAKTKLANGAPPVRSPFQPDADLAEGGSSAAAAKVAANTPEIQRLAGRSSAAPERLAAARNALLAQGGA